MSADEKTRRPSDEYTVMEGNGDHDRVLGLQPVETTNHVPQETSPIAESSDVLGKAVAMREKLIDHALSDLTQRLTRVENKIDARAEVDRLNTKMLIGLTKSQADQGDVLGQVLLRLELISEHLGIKLPSREG